MNRGIYLSLNESERFTIYVYCVHYWLASSGFPQAVREIKRKVWHQSSIWFELSLWLHLFICSFIWQVFFFLSTILVCSGYYNKILFLPVLEAGKFKINSVPEESVFGSPPPSWCVLTWHTHTLTHAHTHRGSLVFSYKDANSIMGTPPSSKPKYLSKALSPHTIWLGVRASTWILGNTIQSIASTHSVPGTALDNWNVSLNETD